MTSMFERWTAGERSPLLYAFGAAAAPVSAFYRLGLAFRPHLRRHFPPMSHSKLIVVSSPLVGGVGKTPLTGLIVSSLQTHGKSVAAVTMGHGRLGTGPASMSTKTSDVPATAVGDEAAEIHVLTSVPVHVDDEPANAIKHLDDSHTFDWVVFDDGVSRRWSGERRVVVLSAESLIEPVRYLPFGRWRTTPGFLRHAIYVAVTFSDDCADTDRIRSRIESWGFSGPIGVFEYRTEGVTPLNSGTPDELPAGRPFVFCGITRPHRFRETIGSLGYGESPFAVYPDHHRYTRADWDKLEHARKSAACTWFLTTLKDAVRLESSWIGSTPVGFVRIGLNQVHGPEIVAALTKDG